MTQTSRPVGEHTNTYPAPAHDSGPYSSFQWQVKEYVQEVGDLYSGSTASGPYYGYVNNLTVTDDGADITIDTGACFVAGNVLINDASVTISPTHPGAPDEYTVVAMLNDTNTAYSTDIDVPATLPNDYNNAASIPAYSCRLAIFQGSPAAMVQDHINGHFMIPLATFDIDAAGAITNLTQDTTVRTYVNAKDKTEFYPFFTGYETDTPGQVFRNRSDSHIASSGVYLSDSIVTYAGTSLMIPEDFISDAALRFAIIPLGSGNIYVSRVIEYGACGETYSNHSIAGPYSAIAVTSLENECVYSTSLSSASIGDLVHIQFARDASDVLDTVNADAVATGVILDYFGYRR